jgi:hypothetical protein
VWAKGQGVSFLTFRTTSLPAFSNVWWRNTSLSSSFEKVTTRLLSGLGTGNRYLRMSPTRLPAGTALRPQPYDAPSRTPARKRQGGTADRGHPPSCDSSPLRMIWGKASEMVPRFSISCRITTFDSVKYAVGPNGRWHTSSPSGCPRVSWMTTMSVKSWPLQAWGEGVPA